MFVVMSDFEPELEAEPEQERRRRRPAVYVKVTHRLSRLWLNFRTDT